MKGDVQFVQVYFTSPDLVYKDKWDEPRFGPLVFNIMLQNVFQATYGYELVINQFGKPHKATYEFANTLMGMQAE